MLETIFGRPPPKKMATQSREVWVAEEAAMTIYEESGSGYADDASYVYAYGQGISIQENDEVEVRGEPGNAFKTVHTTPGSVDCQIDAMSYSKALEFVPFGDRTKSYRVILTCVNPRYDGTTQVNDTYTLYGAKKTGRALTINDTDVNIKGLTLQSGRLE